MNALTRSVDDLNDPPKSYGIIYHHKKDKYKKRGMVYDGTQIVFKEKNIFLNSEINS